MRQNKENYRGDQKLNSEFDGMEEIDLREMIHILRNRYWIIIICFLIAVITSLTVNYKFLVPVYRAESTLFAGKEPNKIASLDLGEFNLNQKLVVDYREIILSRLVTEQVINHLNLDMKVETFRSRVSVSTIKDSRFFKIAFESSDPVMAMDIVNALAQQVIMKAEDIIDIKNVVVIDVAKLPQNPIKPNKKLNVAIASVLGVMMGAFLVFFMEFLDRTIKTEDDVQRYLQLNTIGEIPEFQGEERNIKKKLFNFKNKKLKPRKRLKITTVSKSLISLLDPKAPASEAYRTLRTNIGYAGIDKQVQTIVVTSTGPGEGKSTTTVNLAITMAQVGKKVLIIDADLRKPKLHRYLSLANDYGLTDIIANKYPVEDSIKVFGAVENLHVICSGSIPPNPSEILESKTMLELMESLKDSYDLILIDTPPVGQLTDAAIVGQNSDGVVLVVSSGESNIDMAVHAKSALDKVNARIIGAVLTKINATSGSTYYYRYYNYNQYYYN